MEKVVQWLFAKEKIVFTLEKKLISVVKKKCKHWKIWSCTTHTVLKFEKKHKI